MLTTVALGGESVLPDLRQECSRFYVCVVIQEGGRIARDFRSAANSAECAFCRQAILFSSSPLRSIFRHSTLGSRRFDRAALGLKSSASRVISIRCARIDPSRLVLVTRSHRGAARACEMSTLVTIFQTSRSSAPCSQCRGLGTPVLVASARRVRFIFFKCSANANVLRMKDSDCSS